MYILRNDGLFKIFTNIDKINNIKPFNPPKFLDNKKISKFFIFKNYMFEEISCNIVNKDCLNNLLKISDAFTFKFTSTI